jgi:hypothetical protein
VLPLYSLSAKNLCLLRVDASKGVPGTQ